MNEKNITGKSEIDYLISDEKNIFEKSELKHAKKMFSVSQKTLALIDDETLIKLIDSKTLLRIIINALNKKGE